MEHAQLDSKGWSRLLARLGGEKAIASSAREHGAFVRARGVKSAVDVLRLALMYGPGGHSLRSLAALAAAAGLADISDVAILDRLKNAANWLQALCEEINGSAKLSEQKRSELRTMFADIIAEEAGHVPAEVEKVPAEVEKVPAQ